MALAVVLERAFAPAGFRAGPGLLERRADQVVVERWPPGSTTGHVPGPMPRPQSAIQPMSSAAPWPGRVALRPPRSRQTPPDRAPPRARSAQTSSRPPTAALPLRPAIRIPPPRKSALRSGEAARRDRRCIFVFGRVSTADPSSVDTGSDASAADRLLVMGPAQRMLRRTAQHAVTAA